MKVFFNPGHGGGAPHPGDPGAVAADGHQEDDYALAIAVAAGEQLRAWGDAVGYSRLTQFGADADEPLEQIAKDSDAFLPDLFVSIHLDSAGTTASGSTRYVAKGAGQLSRRAAAFIGTALATLGLPDRGVVEKDFFLTKQIEFPPPGYPRCASVLVEVAYMSNPQEEARFHDPAFVRVVGQKIAQGIWLSSGRPIPSAPEVKEALQPMIVGKASATGTIDPAKIEPFGEAADAEGRKYSVGLYVFDNGNGRIVAFGDNGYFYANAIIDGKSQADCRRIVPTHVETRMVDGKPVPHAVGIYGYGSGAGAKVSFPIDFLPKD